MLNKLTKEQEAKLAYYRDQGLKYGLSTQTNRIEAEKAIDLVYQCGGLQAPEFKFWARSPYEALLMYNILKNTQVWDQLRAQVRAQVGDQVRDQVGDQVEAQVGTQVRDQVGDQVWDQVWHQVGDQVWHQVEDQVWDQLRAQVGAQVGDQVGAQVRNQLWDQVRAQVMAQVGAQVRDQVGDQVWDQVRAQVGDQVGDQVRDQLRAQVWDQLNNFCFGSNDSAWLSFYEFFINEINIKIDNKLKGLIEYQKHAGWFLPYKNLVIMCDNPVSISFNQNKKLHNENRAAIEYSDGFSVYCLNGIRIPAKFINTQKDRLSIKEIFKEQNVDVRREVLKLVSIERLLKETNAKILDQWVDKSKKWCDYKLYDMDFKDQKKRIVLAMKNPSLENTYHYERVEDSCKTVKEALAWRMNLPTYLEPVILT